MKFPWKEILKGAKIGVGIAGGIFTGGTSGVLLSLLPDLVDTVEKAFITQPGSGQTKKLLVLQTALFSIAAAEGISRKDLLDNEPAMDAIEQIIEGVVAFNNAIRRKAQ
jgi:hypothetical protein